MSCEYQHTTCCERSCPDQRIGYPANHRRVETLKVLGDIL